MFAIIRPDWGVILTILETGAFLVVAAIAGILIGGVLLALWVLVWNFFKGLLRRGG